jgi:hypothetical protein
MVSAIEYVREATKTASEVTVRRVCSVAVTPRDAVAYRQLSATSAMTIGQNRKTWPWMDSDQKCCTTLVVLLRAA